MPSVAPAEPHRGCDLDCKPMRAHSSCAKMPGPASGSFQSLEKSSSAKKCPDQVHCSSWVHIKLQSMVTYGQIQKSVLFFFFFLKERHDFPHFCLCYNLGRRGDRSHIWKPFVCAIKRGSSPWVQVLCNNVYIVSYACEKGRCLF